MIWKNSTIQLFKKKVKDLTLENCPCKLCKNYIYDVRYIKIYNPMSAKIRLYKTREACLNVYYLYISSYKIVKENHNILYMKTK